MVRTDGIAIDRATGNIEHRGRVVALRNGPSNYRRRELLFSMILGGPQTLEELFNVLYAHDSDGGPDHGPKVIRIMFAQLNPVLAQAGLRITGSYWYGRGQRYQVESIP